MCEPVSIAAFASTLGASAGTAATIGTVATAATAVAGGLAAYGSYQQAQTQKRMSANNAAMSEIAAQDAQRRGEMAAQAAQRQGNQVEGAQRAAYASRGLDLGVGTPANVIDQTDFFSQSDAATARTNAAREAWGYRAQGAASKYESDSINPGLVATGSLLGTAGSVASRWYSFNRS